MLVRGLEPPERVGAVAVSVEELGGLRSAVQHVLCREALSLTDVSDLVILRGTRIERPTEEQLGHHAAEGPHVDGLAERQAEDDLRGSVVSALQVGVADGLADV